jgi:acyl-CoA reductase-like NAD-dependent aldehyde dehydrogenase
MFNSGQSCCGIQRIYVHGAVYDSFVKHCESMIYSYVLGDPISEKTTLGPLISVAAADAVREVIGNAVKFGAVLLIDENKFPAAKPGSAFVAPQVLLNVNHQMDIMKEECFGPVFLILDVSRL